MTTLAEILELEQGSFEWHQLRKIKITATDAPVIMRASPWKTPLQLYHEKTSNNPPATPNERMKRGTDLEPIARELFTLKTGIKVCPKVIVKDWAMASLDGMSESGNCILEIKCPGSNDHNVAVLGTVPGHYYAQLQHQMYVADVEEMYYFSFDGIDGVIVEVQRDSEFIERMLIEEKKFYDCLINKTPPDADENDYEERTEPLWERCALRWKMIQQEKRYLEIEEEELRDQLVFLSGGSSSRGAGLSLCQVSRKGLLDYSRIPELKNIDLEQYRKPSTTSWRITCH